MHVIFGEVDTNISDKYLLLELDTFYIADANQAMPCFCVISALSLEEFPQAHTWRDSHNQMMSQYRLRNWDYCEQAIQDLRGRWRGELDSFYDEILQRIAEFRVNPPDQSWTAQIQR